MRGVPRGVFALAQPDQRGPSRRSSRRVHDARSTPQEGQLMPWFNVDDGAHSHPKVMSAGNAAFGLFTRLGSYCSAYATEGRVPAAIVRAYGTKTECERLLAAG